MTALDFVERCDDEVKKEEVKTAMREHGAKHSLFYAAEKGMVELVADLIKEGADVNDKNHVSLKCARNRARLCCCAEAAACGEVERGMEMGRTCMRALLDYHVLHRVSE